ncbi:MAG: FCD domain-containing protein [Aliishimia sp.]
MPFRPVTTAKLSDAVVRQIENLILRGILRPGERLPAERDLADQFGVSRPSLREALSDLQNTGLLSAKPGAGVFVADVLGSAFSPALRDLMSRHETAAFDYLAFRRDMEGIAAMRAARVGSDTDLRVVQTVFDKMEAAQKAHRPEEEAQLDAQFHLAIIEASHNVVMLHMMRSMYELLREGVFYNRKMMFDQSTSSVSLLDQHRAINDGIQARDPERAKAAIDAHLDYVQQSLTDKIRADQNESIAQLRLDHER